MSTTDGDGMPVHVRLLGTPEIRVEHVPARFDTRKAVALISYLAVTGRPQRRDAIAALLWPELDHSRARGALRRTLSVTAAGVPALRTVADDVWLDLHTTVCDVTEVLDLAHGDDPTGWATAVIALREPFMAGFRLRDAAPFEEWTAITADQLRDLHATTLGRLVGHEVGTGDLVAALEHARERVVADPLSEPAQTDLIRVLAWTGDQAAAIRQYRSLVRILDRELGVPPLPETVALHDAIRTHQLEPPPTSPQKDRSSPRRPSPTAESEDAQPAGPRPFDTGVVGRDEVIHRLDAASRAARGAGRILGISGEPSMGRTTLARLAATRATDADQIAVMVLGRQAEQGLAFSAAADVVRSVLQQFPSALDKLGASAADLAALVPAVPGVRSIDGPGALRRLHEAVRLTISTAAEYAMVTLVVDDAHLLDQQSAELLAYVLRRCPPNVVVVVTWEQAASGSTLPQAVLEVAATDDILVLEGLTEPAVLQLLRRAGAGDDQLAQIMARTRGVPLLVAEHAAAGQGAAGLAVRDLVAGRLTAAPEVTQQLVGAAAVIGTVADPDLLRLTCGRDDSETVDAIEDAVRRGLLVERADQSGYDLPHDLLRDVALSRIGLARRRLLHGRTADALARRHAVDPAGSPAGSVARHLTEAGRDSEAGGWYWTAAQDSRRLNAHEETIPLLRQALAMGHDPAPTHAAMADAQLRIGAYQEALVSYDQAASFLEGAPEQQGEIERRIADVLDRLGDWDLALGHLDSARTLLRDTDPLQRGLVEADRARTLHRLGRTDEATAAACLAAELAEESADQRAQSRAENILGVLSAASGNLPLAIERLRSAAQLAAECDDTDLVIATLNNLARAQSRAGETEDALTSAEQALASAVSQGDRHREAALHSLLADLWREEGGGDVVYEYLRASAEAFAAVDEASSRPEVWTMTEW